MKRHTLMSVGRIAIEHPWYDAQEADAIFNEQAKTIKRLRVAIKEMVQAAGRHGYMYRNPRVAEAEAAMVRVGNIADTTLGEDK